MDALNNTAFRVEVPGLPPDVASVAEEDIRTLANAIVVSAKELRVPFMLELVRITRQFEEDVIQLFQQKYGFSFYSATRSDVQALGKTLWVRSADGEIKFVVIIDANLIGQWSLTNPQCLTTVLHELAHVVYEGQHLAMLGEEEFSADGDTRERLLDRWARTLLDEFRADRLVDSLVRSLATNENGRPWTLRELDEAQGVIWRESLLAGLRRMPETIDEKVWQYRTRRMDLDALATEVIPYVNDLLVLLAHTASRYLEDAQWDEIVGHIKETDASIRFLGDHLDMILEQFEGSSNPLVASIQSLSDAIEGIFGRCGLTFRTVPEGVWIGVDAPSN